MPKTPSGVDKNELLAPPPRWKITVRKFSDGERRPLLIMDCGVPHFNSILFITTQARNAARMFNTSRAMLDAIHILLIWATSRGIDIEKRFAAHQLLTTTEIESLRGHVQKLIKSQPNTQPSRVVMLPHRIEGSRAKLHTQVRRVQNNTEYTRITYILKYLLCWLST